MDASHSSPTPPQTCESREIKDPVLKSQIYDVCVIECDYKCYCCVQHSFLAASVKTKSQTDMTGCPPDRLIERWMVLRSHTQSCLNWC